MLDAAEVCSRIWEGGTQVVEEIRRKLEAGRTEEPPTLKEESQRYLEWYQELSAVRSMITRRSQLKRGLSLPIDGSTLGEMRIDQVTPSQVERVVLAISDKSNTRESIRIGVSALYTWSTKAEAEQASKENREPR